MFTWVNKEQGGRNKEGDMFQTVTEGLQSLYAKKLLPLEETYLFHDFHSPALEDADFQNKPMVLLVGQYSTGKTTFIRYLLEQDFPGMRIGPEPTTDGFIAVMYNENEGIVPGNALVVDPKKPFRKLNAFGNAFLNRFICSQMPNQVLQSISIIDTPGILSGEKQRISRGYDFSEVLRWFGERVDRIILLFDAHKLDISDEFSQAIKAFRGQDDKIRVVLNKADQVDTQQLMRVYGALMWSLGKVINTPEVVRVYLGSFWAKPLQNAENRHLFEAETQDVFRDIQSLPRNAALRKLNDLIKRARLAKEQLQHYDFSKFPSLKVKLIESVDRMLSTKISSLMNMIREEESKQPTQMVMGGAFEDSSDGPFGHGYGEGISAGADTEDWIVSRDKHRYDEIFYTLMPINGKVTGINAKREMMNSRLPNTVLGKIWKLADCDKDGMLDDEEFALAQHLIKIKLEGFELPIELPNHLVPPSHRKDPTADILYNHQED
ncbi:EH domain-containing protein 4-like [Sinocyclocheilus rhinocerous]|uniref:EH domain-containing protein 4-like n=1 Tax=Sinocyclocheilus rhinocerous TaxID=307959 RepID=UPI0007BAD44B|nr:PREDICTED: EH domain-containing protein 4-like [Sinocyclocheilus rhinocerous]